MNTQTSLFDFTNTPTPAPTIRRTVRPIEKRREAAEQSFKSVDKKWAADYAEFVMECASDWDKFLAENCRDLWLRMGKPEPCQWKKKENRWKGSNGIFRQLVKANKLRIVGTELSPSRGVPATLYTKA